MIIFIGGCILSVSLVYKNNLVIRNKNRTKYIDVSIFHYLFF